LFSSKWKLTLGKSIKKKFMIAASSHLTVGARHDVRAARYSQTDIRAESSGLNSSPTDVADDRIAPTPMLTESVARYREGSYGAKGAVTREAIPDSCVLA
jgi:hypothetical protein